ncbi:hypothetical protein BDR03DRAFT_967391 [Suillus americanus]|nr:hypothetical protein BDR03DRAFT_967391 [Suillus americanus]
MDQHRYVARASVSSLRIETIDISRHAVCAVSQDHRCHDDHHGMHSSKFKMLNVWFSGLTRYSGIGTEFDRHAAYGVGYYIIYLFPVSQSGTYYIFTAQHKEAYPLVLSESTRSSFSTTCRVIDMAAYA